MHVQAYAKKYGSLRRGIAMLAQEMKRCLKPNDHSKINFMRLFFAAILVATIFFGMQAMFQNNNCDILSSWTPALYSGNNYMSFHQLYVIQSAGSS